MGARRSDMRAIAKHGAVNATSEVTKAVLMALTLLILARSVSKDDFGVFALAQTLALFLVPVGSFGMNRAAVRQIAYYKALGDRERINGVVRSAIHIWVFSSMAISIVFFLIAAPLATRFFSDSDLVPTLQLFSVYIAASVVSREVGATFRGFRNVRPKVYFEDIVPRVMVIGGFLYLSSIGAPLLTYTVVYVSCFVTAAVLSMIYLFMNHSFYEPWVPLHYTMLAIGLPLMVQEVLFLSNSMLSVIILAGYSDSATVGSYAAAQKLAVKIPFIFTGMLFTFLPVLSAYKARENVKGMKTVYARFTRWVIIITMPAVLLGLLFPVELMDLLYGPDYRSSWALLMMLVIAHAWQPFLGPAGPTMIALGQVRMLMAFAITTALITVVVSVTLIPVYGAMGAAIATNTAQCGYGLISLAYVYHTTGIHPFNRDYVRLIVYPPAICLLEYLAITSLLGRTMLALLVAIPVVIGTVLSLCLALGIITRSEREIVFAKLKRMMGRTTGGVETGTRVGRGRKR
ncbi:MAG: flippase [Thermoplasmata archaeon]|nr:flippase [Thermoplasmata archaeon]